MQRRICISILATLLISASLMPAAGQEIAYLTTSTQTLQTIDTVTNQVVATSATTAAEIAASPDGALLYGASATGTLQVMDAATADVRAVIAVPQYSGAGRLRITPDGRTAYLAATGSRGLYVVDTTAHTASFVPLGYDLQDFAIAPDGTRVYLVPSASALAPGQIGVMDAASRRTIATVSVDLSAQNASALAAAALTPDGRFLCVPEAPTGALAIIDTQINAVIATIADDVLPQDIAISSDGRLAYVSHARNSLSVVDLLAQTLLTRIALAGSPGRIALANNDTRLYIENLNVCSVTVVDLATNVVLTTIAVGDGARTLITAPSAPSSPTPTPSVSVAPTVTPDAAAARACAYVTQADDRVTVIDTHTQLVIGSFAVAQPGRIAVHPDGTRVFVTNVVNDGATGALALIDTATNSVSNEFILGTQPSTLSLTRDGALAYVGLFGSLCYSAFAVDSDGTIQQRLGCAAPCLTGPNIQLIGIAISPDGRRAYLDRRVRFPSFDSTEISVLDLSSGTTIGTISFEEVSRGIAMTPDGRTVYVSLENQFGNIDTTAVGVIDTAINAVTNIISLGTGTQSANAGPVAIDPSGSFAYVAHSEDNGTLTASVSLINTTTNTLAQSIPLDEGSALGLAFTPDGNFVYALQGQTVSVLAAGGGVVYRIPLPGDQQPKDIAIGTVPYGCVAPLNPIPTATVTSTPSATVTAAQTQTPSATPTSSQTAPPSATGTPSAMATPSVTATPDPTSTATASSTPTSTSTPVPTNTPTATIPPPTTATPTMHTGSGGGCSIGSSAQGAYVPGYGALLVAALLLCRRRSDVPSPDR